MLASEPKPTSQYEDHEQREQQRLRQMFEHGVVDGNPR